jgi:hypothetical protein
MAVSITGFDTRSERNVQLPNVLSAGLTALFDLVKCSFWSGEAIAGVLSGLWTFLFAQPEPFQLSGQYLVSKKEDRRC